MRLWSIHPKYLDAKGLVALWREALLAKAVLENKTTGYKNHPQLKRFKEQKNPIKSIDNYLAHIFDEATKRNYKFSKRDLKKCNKKINVTSKQIEFEFNHLKQKLKNRDLKKFNELKNTKEIETHPSFSKTIGSIEDWERHSEPSLLRQASTKPRNIGLGFNGLEVNSGCA